MTASVESIFSLSARSPSAAPHWINPFIVCIETVIVSSRSLISACIRLAPSQRIHELLTVFIEQMAVFFEDLYETGNCAQGFLEVATGYIGMKCSSSLVDLHEFLFFSSASVLPFSAVNILYNSNLTTSPSERSISDTPGLAQKVVPSFLYSVSPDHIQLSDHYLNSCTIAWYLACL